MTGVAFAVKVTISICLSITYLFLLPGWHFLLSVCVRAPARPSILMLLTAPQVYTSHHLDLMLLAMCLMNYDVTEIFV